MNTSDWSVRAQGLNADLRSIEEAAGHGQIPPDAIAEIRRAVDHCRNTLWDVVIATSKEGGGRDAVLLASRLSRIQEMCSRVVEEIAAGRVWSGTPGLARFVAALDETERRVNSLLHECATADGAS